MKVNEAEEKNMEAEKVVKGIASMLPGNEKHAIVLIYKYMEQGNMLRFKE